MLKTRHFSRSPIELVRGDRCTSTALLLVSLLKWRFLSLVDSIMCGCCTVVHKDMSKFTATHLDIRAPHHIARIKSRHTGISSRAEIHMSLD